MGGLELAGTTVFITGGSRGIGRAMTLALADAGASIFIASNDASGIRNLCDLYPDIIGGEFTDLTNEGAVEHAVSRCLETFGGLNVVVNNAGIGMTAIRPDCGDEPVRFWEPPIERVRAFFEIDTIAPINVAQQTLPCLRAQGWGRFVTVTTSLDTMIRSGQSPYGPAKAATEAFASVMAHELEGSGITSNVLVPGGATDTDMVSTRMGMDRSSLLRPEIMGPPIAWLASRASDGFTAKRITASRWNPARSIDENLAEAARPIAWPTDRQPSKS